jgi:hypothetical protein
VNEITKMIDLTKLCFISAYKISDSEFKLFEKRLKSTYFLIIKFIILITLHFPNLSRFFNNWY